MDDSSVWLGGALVVLGVVCVVLQIRWAASDRRRELEAAEAAGEDGPGGAPAPETFAGQPVHKRL